MSERCHPWRALIIAAQARELADADLCGDLDFSNVDDVCGRLETPEAIAHRERSTLCSRLAICCCRRGKTREAEFELPSRSRSFTDSSQV